MLWLAHLLRKVGKMGEGNRKRCSLCLPSVSLLTAAKLASRCFIFLQHYMQNSCRTYSMGSGYILVVPPDLQHSCFLHLMVAGLNTRGILSECRPRKSQGRDSSLPSLTSHRERFLCEWKISKKKKRKSTDKKKMLLRGKRAVASPIY